MNFEREPYRSMPARRRRDRIVLEALTGVVQDRLQAVLTPERPLGEVDGITVVLMRVELWSARLLLRFEAVRNELTAALDAMFDAEWEAYQRRWTEDRARAKAEELWPPEQASVSRLNGLPVSLTDDVGTRYLVMGRVTGGSEHYWRSEWRVEPEAPFSASVLRVALDDGEPGRGPIELVLPARSAA